MIGQLMNASLVVVAGALAAVAVIVGLRVVGRARGHASGHGLAPWIVPAVLVNTAAAPLLLGRSYADGGAWNILVDSFSSPALGWLSRIVSVLLIAAFVQVLWQRAGRRLARRIALGTSAPAASSSPGAALRGRAVSPVAVAAHGGRQTRIAATAPARQKRPAGVPSGQGLLAALGVYCAGSLLLPALFAAHPVLSHEFLYAPMIGATMLMAGESTRRQTLAVASVALEVFLAAGLLLLVLRPEMVRDFGYDQGLLGGLPRFSGLAPHPVSLSMLALLALFMRLERPLASRWAQAALLALPAVALLLAQSKSSWFVAVNGVALLMMGRSLAAGPARTPAALLRRRTRLALLGAGVCVVVLAAPVAMSLLSTQIDRFMASGVGQSLASGTGRDVIWDVALAEFRSHPLFGYGLTLFDQDYRLAIGLPFATHGHNQFIDSLGRTGLVGTVSLVILLAALIAQFIRVRPAALMLPGVLFLMLLLRSLSEVPWNLQTYGPEQLPIWILFIALRQRLHVARAARRESAPLALALPARFRPTGPQPAPRARPHGPTHAPAAAPAPAPFAGSSSVRGAARSLRPGPADPVH